eukprot:COSAG01_NODE_72560_length_252_cov_1.738562_1_plen_40_part_10
MLPCGGGAGVCTIITGHWRGAGTFVGSRSASVDTVLGKYG